ncbi:MAG: UPF0182 family protein [Bryobacterales bacterium]
MEPRQIRNIVLIALAFFLIAGSRGIANFVIEYEWWQEMGQIDTWFSILGYQFAPALLAGIVAWLAALWANARGMAFAGVPRGAYGLYNRLSAAVLLLASFVFLAPSIEAWKVMAFVGSLGIEVPPDVWQDPVFSKDLSFYLFNLPFYYVVLRYVLGLALFVIVVFWASARGWQLYERFQRYRSAGGTTDSFDPGPNPLLLEGATETSFARILGSILLAGAAVWFFLGQYSLLHNQHNFMTGMDWVDENIRLPLRWFVVAALLGAIPLLWMRKLRIAVGVAVAAVVANAAIPSLVAAIRVTPNELEYERDYIARHIEATREAYDLRSGQEVPFAASLDETLDVEAHATLVDNIRLWDTQAFTDTITQIQALRPYYRFADIDIDRYEIDGRIKQVLLSPREIDINALPAEARSSWINTHFIYTHGYGVVMSEVNRTTPDGLPVLMIQDAPPQIRTDDLKLTNPSIYYGEITHDPVFVATNQEEFDYPAENTNITSHYAGKGGFPIDSIPLRLAAALTEGDFNILLTGLTNPQSRMMIYRDVHDRLAHLADFIEWDSDPYLMITKDGRLVWIVDGYTMSDVHPYSAPITVNGLRTTRRMNYIRNSVKATVDAYDGTTKIYVFDERDPIVSAYRSLFPDLFLDEAEMPADIRAHTRYPLLLFKIQAELYRIFHMTNPDVFYNKEDEWDIARSLAGASGQAEPMDPTYIVARLPGEPAPEFILMLPFTPRGKDNLIGWMAARCDGQQLGQKVYYQLSKQQLVFGPNQIESRINQDQNIARDLTLWNQQGSRVLRGDILALPFDDSFLYVESIYIQAESARMPQLKKVVLAMGNRLIYEDTFEQALDRLSEGGGKRIAPPGAEPGGVSDAAPTQRSPSSVRTLAEQLSDLRKQAEALARELERMEREAKQQ